MAEPRNLVIIEDSTIKSFMEDPRFLDLLPCLTGAKRKIESIAPGKPNCDKCKKERAKLVSDAMGSAKECIRNLRGTRLDKFKRLLNTRQVRLTVKNARNQLVKYTI